MYGWEEKKFLLNYAVTWKQCLILKKVDTFRNTKLSTLWI